MEKHYEILEVLFNTIPYVFWKDRDGRYQGGNQNQARNMGFRSPAEFVGKTIFEILKDKKAAQFINEIDNKVMNENITIVSEEKIIGTSTNGEKVYLSQKSPIRNEDGKVIGMIGFAMDITEIKRQEEIARKETERLKLENEIHKNVLVEREKFKLAAQQVAHDINSPLGGLLMIIGRLDPKKPIPETERLNINEALNEIRIVTDELVNYDKIEADPETHKKDKPQVIPVSVTLSQFLAVKQSEYKNLPIKLETAINKNAYAAFIKIEPTALKRSLSNIINNARDSFEGRAGTITLKLEATKTQVKITIQDNGKGMPPEIVEKIMNKIAVTSDKADGHGFGMTQVSETLARNHSTLKIDSTLNQGTKVILTFPRIEAPFWFAEELSLDVHDLIVVLDDDATMHHGWDACLKETLAKYPGIRLEHIYEGEKAVEFINNANDKQKIVLLTDYELSDQPLNGLDVIEKTKIKRSLLVTSHYEKPDIQGRAISLDTKIVPKQSAAEIPIKAVDGNFDYAINEAELQPQPFKKVDIVVVDDNKRFAELLKSQFEMFDKTAECYYDPRKLLKELSQYHKDTRICVDNNFEGGIGMTGVEVAEKLHALGYTKLYLFSGDVFEPGELPDYLTAIVKSDPDFVRKIFA